MPIYTSIKQTKTLNKQKIEELLESRGIESITFLQNMEFSRDFLKNKYGVIRHVWSHGDKLYKLAYKYFDDKDLFWIIGLYNNKPTDAHYKYGDEVFIPVDFFRFISDVVK